MHKSWIAESDGVMEFGDMGLVTIKGGFMRINILIKIDLGPTLGFIRALEPLPNMERGYIYYEIHIIKIPER